MTDAATSNGRVTNAILATKLDAVHEDVKGICTRLDAHDERIRTLEQEQAKQGERISTFARVQAGFSVLSSAIGAGIAWALGKQG